MRDMYDQPRYKPMHASPLFPDGTSARPPVPGTLAAGKREEFLAGLEKAQQMPLPVTMALLRQGRERFDIFCAPCHSVVGDGDGMVVRRGFPSPPSYHTERLREAPDRHLFDVITNGYGVMYSYANRIPADERWAIVAYIRALQLSQYASADDLK
jgi:mono/diheme cytochrome c family protein